MKQETINKILEKTPAIDFLMCPYCGKKYQIPAQTNKKQFCCHNTPKRIMKRITMWYDLDKILTGLKK